MILSLLFGRAQGRGDKILGNASLTFEVLVGRGRQLSSMRHWALFCFGLPFRALILSTSSLAHVVTQ